MGTVSEDKTISAKLPPELYREMQLRIPEGDRSNFIRQAILEKLEKTPKPDKVLALEERMGKLEQQLTEIRKALADLEILTYGHDRVNPHSFCLDEVDHKIVDYLVHYKGATTPELADYVKVNRWLVLNRLRKIQKTSRKQHGKPVIDYYAGEKSGKKKAWWMNKEFVEEEAS